MLQSRLVYVFCTLCAISVSATSWSEWLGLAKSSAVAQQGKSAKIVDTNKNDTFSITQLIEEAKSHLEHGDVQRSIDLLLSAVESDPDSRECNSLLGGIFVTQQKFDLSDKFLLNAALLSNWTDLESIVSLSASLRLRGEYETAFKMMNTLLQKTKNNDTTGKSFLEMGHVMYNQENYSQAAEWYLRSAMAVPSEVDIWILASTLEYPDGHIDLVFAENVLKFAMTANDRSALLPFYLGRALHLSSQIEEAITAYEIAISLCEPTSHTFYDAVAALATIHHEEGVYDTAESYYQAAVQISPDNVLLLSNYATLLASMNKMDEGWVIAKQAVDLDSSSVHAAQAMGLFVLKL